jgi:ABC-type nitrate/sulfonate/bicarbonate transport system permease component
VYAAIFVIGVCGFALDQALLWVQRRVVYWQPQAE